jgi:2-polyprenyl-6-hydroxyphenyl methylase/3-demethylubiquinone-9 3-methyltransferase
MSGYYSEKLAAERLRGCYEVASPRIQAYLEAEIGFVRDHASASTRVLELGCGYGRVLERLVPVARSLVGIDTSLASLRLARSLLGGDPRIRLAAMDAASLGFAGRCFDLTICIQNGICAFGVDPARLLGEAARVTRRGGTVLFSSYAARFWPERLAWFRAQAARGLIGEIDPEATGNGVIACKDGFRTTTMSPAGFAELAAKLELVPTIAEVDGSSVFCEIVVP